MRAEIIITGTELLTGEVINTNAQYLGQQLSQLGVEVILHTTVGDCWKRMAEVFRQALGCSDVIITTGGLGPTTDDLTKETVAEVLELPMTLDEAARVLTNPVGTAPGVLLEYQEKLIICLPGPPFELIPTFATSVIPYLSKLVGRSKWTISRLFKLTGISESVVQDRLKDLCLLENPHISFMAKPGEVHVRITGNAEEPDKPPKMVDELAEKVHTRLESFIFGVDNEVLEDVVGNLLAETGSTIALAESCTGGLISARLTEIPGSSRYLLGGVVAYDNKVKEEILQVPRHVLENRGAVSEQTAVAMAQGVRKLIGADFGLAVTGIAGPGGGSLEKPQGLVFIALAAPDSTGCRKFLFPGERAAVRQGTANAALNMVRLYLLDKAI